MLTPPPESHAPLEPPPTEPPTLSPPAIPPSTPPDAAPAAAPPLDAAPDAVGEPLPRDDLPPDFWDDLPPPEPAASVKPPEEAAREEGGLEADPRFAVLQSLFPGHVVEWQEAGAGDVGDDESDVTEEAVQETLQFGEEGAA